MEKIKNYDKINSEKLVDVNKFLLDVKRGKLKFYQQQRKQKKKVNKKADYLMDIKNKIQFLLQTKK